MLLGRKGKKFVAADLNKNDWEDKKRKEMGTRMDQFKTTLKKEYLTPEDLAKVE